LTPRYIHQNISSKCPSGHIEEVTVSRIGGYSKAFRRAAAGAFAALALIAAAAPGARAAEATVAVAANFAEPLEVLQKMLGEETGHDLVVVSGSTGKLYAQIVNGAPFDVLLAADQERPAKLAEEDQGEPASVFTYAIGRLTLWSPQPDAVAQDGVKTLRDGDFLHLAIANPELAPYGLAAQHTLQNLGLWEELQGRLVRGENIAQTFQMVESGNADLGFVALSYVVSKRNKNPGSRWDVPAELHEPIRQDAILLRRGAANEAAKAFLAFLRSPEAREVIERFGYAVDRVS
jgi:molybdate transport system substrate-binding protein